MRLPARLAPRCASLWPAAALRSPARPAVTPAAAASLVAPRHRSFHPSTGAGSSSTAGRSPHLTPSATAFSSEPSSDDDAAAVEEEVEEVLLSPPLQLSAESQTTTTDIETLLNRVARDEINLAPRYQRKYIWKPEKAHRLIESVMSSLFVPAVVLHTDAQDVDNVVDGKQRITTFQSFLEGRFPNGDEFRLQGLALLTELNGKTYADLPDTGPLSKRTFKSFALPVSVFKKRVCDEAILRVYEDLNCGAENLNKQQIRRMVYGGPLIDLLEELARDPRLLEVRRARLPCKDESDQELILRFFMLHCHQAAFKGNLQARLNIFMGYHRNLESPGKEEEWRQLFMGTLEAVFKVYGTHAFYRWKGRGYDKDISTALFDSVMLTFAGLDADARRRAAQRSEAVVRATRELCGHEDFSTARFSAERFRSRLLLYGNMLSEVLDLGRSRTFPQQDKLRAELFRQQDGKCALCGGVLQNWQDAHLDHKEPFSKGGTSDPANAQLVHGSCNQAKGARTALSC